MRERDAERSRKPILADEVDRDLDEPAALGRGDVDMEVHAVERERRWLRHRQRGVRAALEPRERDDERNERANQGQTLQRDGGRV
jgi:hypothetical protein